MARSSRVRRVLGAWHVRLCLRWPTLVAVAAIRALRQTPRADVQSILVVRPDGLGDCILTLPLLDSLRHCFSSARITVLTTPMAAPLFAASPAVDRVVTLCPASSPRWPKYLRGLLGAVRAWVCHLRGHRFDVAILPRWDADIYHGTLLCVLSGAPVRTGHADDTSAYKMSVCGGFQRAWTVAPRPGPSRHEALRALESAAGLGCNPGDPVPHVFLSEADRRSARAWLQTALHPTASARTLIAVGLPAAEAKKRWTAALYILALREITSRRSVVFVLFSDRETAGVACAVHDALPASCIAHQLPLMMAAAILGECELFIGADSGLGHLAAAVGCTTVTLFAQAATATDHTGWHGNSPERFRPLSARGIVLQPEHTRPGCEDGCRAAVPHCILDIPPERVAEAVTSLLTTSEGGYNTIANQDAVCR